MNTDNRLSYGPSLENIVYLFLVSNDYQVSIGKIGKFECDFIVRNHNQNYAYIQVAYLLFTVRALDRIISKTGSNAITPMTFFLLPLMLLTVASEYKAFT